MNIADLASEAAIKIYSYVATFLVVPLIGWINSKRKDLNALEHRVGLLERDVNSIKSSLEDDRRERKERDKIFMEKMDSIHKDVTEVKIASAVNASKLEKK